MIEQRDCPSLFCTEILNLDIHVEDDKKSATIPPHPQPSDNKPCCLGGEDFFALRILDENH